MALLPVSAVYESLLDDCLPLPAEMIPLAEADGRVLAAPLPARRTQPPFNASAMDGYAVRSRDTNSPSCALDVIGQAAAGHGFTGELAAGQAVRIFTGAPVPQGADAVLIQENALRLEGNRIFAKGPLASGANIRNAGKDFEKGDVVLPSGRLLDPAALSLAAAANHPEITVIRQPVVGLIATGDELVLPGQNPGPAQIIASNSFGVAAIARRAGASVIDFGIVADRMTELRSVILEASQRCDVVITLGGASVGDHDLVKAALEAEGMQLAFWKIAMRPGKPLMFGRLGKTRMLGLPGNPVASLICSHLFLAPMIAKLAGREHSFDLREAVLKTPLRENDLRQDYLRAIALQDGEEINVEPFPVQDSSMLQSLARANCLIIRPPFAPAAQIGERVKIMMIR